MTEIRLFTAQTQAQGARPQLVDPREAAAAGAALTQVASGLESLIKQRQGQRRVAVLSQSLEALGTLQQEIDAERDPDRLPSLVADRTRAIREAAERDLADDPEGKAQIGLRLVDNFSSLTRMAAQRTRTLREDAFKAALNESFNTLATQAARGGEGVNGQAVRNFQAMLDEGVTSGNLTRVEAATLAQRFRGQVETAQVLELIRVNPGAAVAALSDPARFPSLAPEQRERLITIATTRQDMLARRAEAKAAAIERAVLVEANQIDEALYAGFPMTDRLEALRAKARGTAAAPVVERLAADAAAVTQFRALPAAQQVEALTAAEAKARAPGATLNDVQQFGRLQRAFAGQQQGIDRRGLQQAVNDGIVERLPPINLGDPASVAAHASAAQVASRHYGRPVSALTEDAAKELAQQFGQLPPDQRGQALDALMAIADPEVRAATIQQVERLRGDGGKMPPGTIARVAQIRQNGPEGAAVSDRIMAMLSVDVSERARQAGESAELRAAMENVATSGLQGVLAAQSSVTLDPRYAATATRDLELIQRVAANLMAEGKNATAAVRQATQMVNYGYATVDVRGEARVVFPANVASPAEVRTGLQELRDRAASAPLPGADAGAEAAGVGRARRDALRAGEWINEGNRFSLVVISQGRAVPVLTVTMDEVKAAAAGVTSQGRFQQRERALDRTARERLPRPLEPVDEQPASVLR